MKTLSYVLGKSEEIKIGQEYYFGQLGDGEELIESGTISPDNESTVAFEVTERADDLAQAVVKVTDIY